MRRRNFGISLILTPAIVLAEPIVRFAACAQARDEVDILEYYMLPFWRSVKVHMDNGEVFSVEQAMIKGRAGFYIQKNNAWTNYEEFFYDDDYIYHGVDTSWVHLCMNGNEAAFTMLNGVYEDPRVAYETDPKREGGIWIKRRMRIGEIDRSVTTIVALDKKTGETCSSQYDGHGGKSMQLVSADSWRSPSGLVFYDVVRFVTIDGMGKGENYYVARGYGWVGFEVREGDPVNGRVVTSAYAESIEEKESDIFY